MDALINQ